MAAAMIPKASSAYRTALGRSLTSRPNGPFLVVDVVDVAGWLEAAAVGARVVAAVAAATVPAPMVAAVVRVPVAARCPAAARRPVGAVTRRAAGPPACPEG